MNRNVKPISPRAVCQSKFNSARMNLLLVLAMTLVNIVILCLGSDRYFLFSATVPYFLAMLGMLWSGSMPDEYYTEWPETTPFFGTGFLTVMLVIAALILLVYLCCFLFSKKNKVGWMLTAAVFFGIDTLGMLVLYGFSTDSIIDIVFHVWVLYYLIMGTVNGFKLKKLPEEEPVEVNGEAVEVPYVEINAPEAPAEEEKTEEGSEDKAE